MHLALIILAVVCLSIMLHSDLRRPKVNTNKSALLFLLTTAFITILGTVLNFWWMRVNQCPLFMHGAFDSMSSLAVGFALIIMLIGFFILIARRQLKCKHVLALVEPCQDAVVCEKINTFSQKLALKRPPKVFFSNTQKPFAATFSALEPVILLSNSILSQLDSDELDAVLIHELYHIAQNDLWTILWARLVSEFLWFVPAVQRVFHSFLRATECWADHLTITLTQKPGALASALLKFHSAQGEPIRHEPLYFFSPRYVGFLNEEEAGHFEYRLNLLLDNDCQQRPLNTFSLLNLHTLIFAIGWLLTLWLTPYCLLL